MRCSSQACLVFFSRPTKETQHSLIALYWFSLVGLFRSTTSVSLGCWCRAYFQLLSYVPVKYYAVNSIYSALFGLRLLLAIPQFRLTIHSKLLTQPIPRYSIYWLTPKSRIEWSLKYSSTRMYETSNDFRYP